MPEVVNIYEKFDGTFQAQYQNAHQEVKGAIRMITTTIPDDIMEIIKFGDINKAETEMIKQYFKVKLLGNFT